MPVYSVWRAGSKGEPMWFTSTWTFPGDWHLAIVNKARCVWMSGKGTGENAAPAALGPLLVGVEECVVGVVGFSH